MGALDDDNVVIMHDDSSIIVVKKNKVSFFNVCNDLYHMNGIFKKNCIKW